MAHGPILAWLSLLLTFSGTIWLLVNVAVFTGKWIFPAFVEVTELVDAPANGSYNDSLDNFWYPPNDTPIGDLVKVINGSDAYGFIFNDSSAPVGNDYYGGYNYCNMPHVNKHAYIRASNEYNLEYVEVVSC